MEPQQSANESPIHSHSPNPGDEVAKIVEWSPLVRGGANFRTHKLKNVGYHIYIAAPTVGYHIFYSVFLFFGIGAFVLASLRLDESWFLFGILLFMGSVFGGVGVYMISKALKPFTIDLDLGVFYKGRSYDPYEDNPKGTSGSVKDIHAIQLISERVKSDSSSYMSYELNLVLKDGRRINVTDHGRRKKIYEDATALSEMLDIPIWDLASWVK